MPFLPLFTGIHHSLAHVLSVPPTKAWLLCTTPAGMDLYRQAMPAGTYRVQSPGFPKIIYSQHMHSNNTLWLIYSPPPPPPTTHALWQHTLTCLPPPLHPPAPNTCIVVTHWLISPSLPPPPPHTHTHKHMHCNNTLWPISSPPTLHLRTYAL